MNDLYARFDRVFFEKTRLSMLTILFDEGKVTFSRLRQVLKGTDGRIYSHLNKLEESGYIFRERILAEDSVQSCYALTAKGKQAFKEYLEFIKSMLSRYPDNDKKT